MSELPNIVFFGSDAICLPVLNYLQHEAADECVLRAVVSQPDRRQGRGKKLQPNPVAAWAAENGVELLQPESPTRELAQWLATEQTAVSLVMAYGHFFQKALREAAPQGMWNFHGSLLPNYRGASPVETALAEDKVSVKGSKGFLELMLHSSVGVSQDGSTLQVAAKETTRQSGALAGTFRSLINNMIVGVSVGFEKKLELRGVGYRAKAEGKKVNLTVGYSHPIDYVLPEGVMAQTPTQTEIVLTGADKQKVGQVAAEIRDFRPPEPYKGKGIRYVDEHVFRKEAKKK